MHGNLPVRHGGKIIVDALRNNGVDTVFCLPGESFLGILDALLDTPEIKLVTCRHEAGAAFMAEAYGKLTGKPAVCLVTRPGGVQRVDRAARGEARLDADDRPDRPRDPLRGAARGVPGD